MTVSGNKCRCFAMMGKTCCVYHNKQEANFKHILEERRKIWREVKENLNGACQVIKGNDRKCKNYARKGMTCCWSHRALEHVEYVPEPESEPEKEAQDTELLSEPEKHACCGKTLKGTDCMINAEVCLGLDTWYCWRHVKQVPYSSESSDIDTVDTDSEWSNVGEIIDNLLTHEEDIELLF